MVFSSGSIATSGTAVPVSDWLSASASLNVMADESGSNPHPGKEPPSTSPFRNKSREPGQRRLTLLLAEDNLPDALLVREAIGDENLPVEVHTAPDGERALEFIARAELDQDAPCPDIFLLDLNLPRVDGFEILRRIRASGKCKNVPVLIVSSSDSPADRAEAARLGAGYFRKPVSYSEFVKVGPFLRRFLEENGLL